MPNDNYYVVIVPQADQASQAVAAARAAGHVHALRQERAARPGASKAAPPSRAHAATSKAPARTPAARGGSRQRLRTWSVVVGDQKYDVTDFGALCGYKIECGGALVWTGVLSGQGHDTHTTTLPADTLKEVLRLAYVGDQREAAKAGRTESAPSVPPSAAPKSETRTKPDQAAEAKPKRQAKAKRKAAATTPASAKAAPPSAKPKSETKAKRRAKKAASPKSGPPTQRTPAAAPSAKEHRAAPSVDDKTVLAGLMKKLRKEDPATAEQSFAALKRIWLGGGREATVEWMKLHSFPSALDAFSDWVEKHIEAAQAMLDKAPHSAPKSAKVA